MANRRLPPEKIIVLSTLAARIEDELEALAEDNYSLLFALRRRLCARIMHMARTSPDHRRRLRAAKWDEQQGRCAVCGTPLRPENAELDRFDPVLGFTPQNTRLIHPDCGLAAPVDSEAG